MCTSLLLSIKPKFALKISGGEKTVELRRVKPRLVKGDVVIVYVSAPVSAIIGFFSVNDISSLPPTELWPKIKSQACITKKDFGTYFNGSTIGHAIYIGEYYSFEKSLTLPWLKLKWDWFSPPQGYRYLSKEQASQILRNAGFQEDSITQPSGDKPGCPA